MAIVGINRLGKLLYKDDYNRDCKLTEKDIQEIFLKWKKELVRAEAKETEKTTINCNITPEVCYGSNEPKKIKR